MKQGKHIFQIAIFIMVIFGMSSCKKTYKDALPKVSIVSIVQYNQDSVLITGNIDSPGAKSVNHVGFAYSQHSSFNVMERQVLLEGQTGEFSAVVTAYEDSVYYFKAFASNDFGYSTSEVMSYKVPHSPPASAPCSIPDNTFIDDVSNTTISTINTGSSYAPYGIFGVEAISGGINIVHIEFNKKPGNGIYTTVNSQTMSNGNPRQVYVTVNGYQVQTGINVYIAENGGSTTISFCNLNYYGFSTSSASAKFTY